MSKVEAKEFNLCNILKERYSIEDYQREYRWKEKQITDLLEDLTEKFLNSNGEDHYFLGSIIISERDDQQQFIIDGQQRLTSLTLLLIYIYRTLKDQEALKGKIDKLIYSKDKGFNLNVAPRNECMHALRDGKSFDKDGQPESIVNIVECYENIEEDFRGHLAGDTGTPSDELELAPEALPKFAEWLIEKVYLVRITTDSDANAFAIFETMNDRGVNLTPTEMLKGYLLTKSPELRRQGLNETWKNLISKLKSIGPGEDADAIKAWLRSQHAQDTRERKKNAPPRDFERIGTEFHRWVSDKVEEKEEDKKIKGLQFTKEDDFANFISEDFSFYGKWYKFIRDVALKRLPLEEMKGMEAIRYNARNNFTLQRTVLLAPLRKGDDKATILRKLRIVSSYLDILIARRIWNYQSTAYSTMQYNMFLLIQDIRDEGIGIDDLKEILFERLKEMEKTEDPEKPHDSEKPYESLKTFGLHSRNTPRVRYLLARMTDYVQTQSGGTSRYDDYINYEVEHIWATNQYKEDLGYQDDFDHEWEFLEYRDRIGGLLLLPKKVNNSLGDKPYKDENASLKDNKDKITAYSRQSDNPLAYSLHEVAYDTSEGFPGFQQFIKRSNLEFKHHDDFKKEDLDERQELYRELCKQIWNPEKLRDM